jgi:3-oxoacyl-[acyl-carrier protein] reductase
MEQDLRGRVAVVTGGSRGIGKAIAAALTGRGMHVVIGARTEGDVARTAEELTGPDHRVIGVRCDVRNRDDCRALIDTAEREFGRLDLLVNNAGVGRFEPVADLGADDWHAVIETNLNGVYYCTHGAIPLLRRGGGWIINIGSLAGKNAFPGGAAYNASKFGLIGFSEALMQEVRHDGIRVSYVMPGSVATEFSHPSGSGSGDESWKVQPEDIAQIVVDLLDTPERTLPSRVEVRPSRPPQK